MDCEDAFSIVFSCMSVFSSLFHSKLEASEDGGEKPEFWSGSLDFPSLTLDTKSAAIIESLFNYYVRSTPVQTVTAHEYMIIESVQ